MIRGVMLCAVLAGCTLVDQNTFNPHAGDSPVVPPAPVAAPPFKPDPLALLTVLSPGGDLSAGDRADVRRAVMSARARKRDVQFDVTAIVPPDAASPGAGAPAVQRAIIAEGVAPVRVHLMARPEPGASGAEIRVYVR